MKKLFTLCLSLASLLMTAQMPPAITIDPPDATAYDELTLTFDPAEACFQFGSLEGLDSIAIHSGVTYLNGPQWQHVVDYDDTGANGQSTILYPSGDGRFSITYIPFEFYGFPEGSVITEICAVFNNSINWMQDGRDFQPIGSDCMDFFIPISLGSSCLPEGITFSSQMMIDNFQTVFPWCTEIEGDVQVSGEDINSLSGLNVLTSVEGYLYIFDNDLLLDLTGLDSLSFVGGDLIIEQNFNMVSLTGIEKLAIVKGNLHVYNCHDLTNLTGLDGLDSIGGGLNLGGNHGLVNLTGIDGLSSVGDYLFVSGNIVLEDLMGIGGLTSMDGTLLIATNNYLTGILDLQNLDPQSIFNLKIFDNPLLASCEAQSICDYLVDPNGQVEIYDNASGCNSQLEIEEACGIVAIDNQYLIGGLKALPNPFSDFTSIVFNLTHPGDIQLTVINCFGERLIMTNGNSQESGKQKVYLDMQNIPAGIYYCIITSGDEVGTLKMIKLE